MKRRALQPQDPVLVQIEPGQPHHPAVVVSVESEPATGGRARRFLRVRMVRSGRCFKVSPNRVRRAPQSEPHPRRFDQRRYRGRDVLPPDRD